MGGNLVSGNLVSTSSAELQGFVSSTGFNVSGGFSSGPTPAQIIAAGQAAWFISFLTGSDTNDGSTSATALQTWGEYYRRTAGLTPTPANVVVTIIDLPVTPPVLLLGYLVIPNGTIVTVIGTRTTVISSTATAYRVENAATNTARAITQVAVTWPALVSNQRGVFTNGVASGAGFWPVKNEGAGVGRISPPTLPNGTYPANPSPGDAFTLYTVPVASEADFLGVIEGDFAGTTGIVFKDLDIGSPGTAGTDIEWSGLGTITFVNCLLQNYSANSTAEQLFNNCQAKVQFFQTGGSLNAQNGGAYFNCTGVISTTLFLGNVYFCQSNLVAIGGRIVFTQNIAIFDNNNFGSFAAIQLGRDVANGNFFTPFGSGPGFCSDGGKVMYGTGNSFSVSINEGSGLLYTSAWPAATTRSDLVFDNNQRAWGGAPYIDAATASRAMIAANIIVAGNTGGGVGGKPSYAQVTVDQAALNANIFTAIPGVTVTVVNAGTCAYQCEFTVSGQTSGAVTGIQFRLLVNGATTPLGATDAVTTTIAAQQSKASFNVKVTLPQGSNIIAAQYNAGAGAAIRISPNTQSDNCSLLVTPGLP